MKGISDFSFRSWTDFGECNLAAVDFGGTLVLTICENFYNKDIIKDFIDICDEKGIPYSIDPNVGESWTDADCYYEAGTGIRTMLVSMPLRYMHTPTEQLYIEDGISTARALTELIAEFPKWHEEEVGKEYLDFISKGTN